MAEWVQADFTVIPSEDLKAINDKLEQAINFLDTLEQGLDALSDLVSILALIESLVNDFFGFLLAGIIDDFNKMVNDFKYTGVYALDLTSINFIPDISVERVHESDMVVDFAKTPSVQSKLGKAFGKKKGYADKFTFTAPFTGKKGSFKINAYYRRQTYRQWLKIITDAFEDENDLPSYKAWGDLYARKDKKEPFAKSAAQVEIGEASPHPYELAYLRPGRPNFGPTGHIDCYVFAFAVADIVTFLQTLGAFSKVFYDLTNLDEYTEMLEKYKTIGDVLKNGIINDLSKWDLLPGEYVNLRGTPPDFIGMNAAQILAPLFAILDRLTKKLKSIFKTVNTGIADYLEATIEALRRQIDELREVVNVIRQLIKLLADIINLNGLYMLNITTDNGLDGIVEELNNATGFKGDSHRTDKSIGSANPRLYIGGALFCYGYPSTDSNNYNLSKAWDDRKAILKNKETTIADKYNRSTDTLKRLFG